MRDDGLLLLLNWNDLNGLRLALRSHVSRDNLRRLRSQTVARRNRHELLLLLRLRMLQGYGSDDARRSGARRARRSDSAWRRCDESMLLRRRGAHRLQLRQLLVGDHLLRVQQDLLSLSIGKANGGDDGLLGRRLRVDGLLEDDAATSSLHDLRRR